MNMNKIYLLYRCNRDIVEDRAAKPKKKRLSNTSMRYL